MPLHYVIGDLHGRFDLLLLAINAVRDDARIRKTLFKIVLLGDYVDRGPHSRQVVQYLMALRDAICLKGNHEAMMVRALSDGNPSTTRLWIMRGGLETLRSYGAQSLKDLNAIPGADFGWLSSLPTLYSDRHRIYVHAGLEPGVPAAEQSDDVRMWVRDRFLLALREDFPDKKHIVHGHTAKWVGKPDGSVPELLRHRTNLDTEAYLSGVLTVAVFDDDQPGGPSRLITIKGHAASPAGRPCVEPVSSAATAGPAAGCGIPIRD